MRSPNDLLLAENCEGIHIILGGHDHIYEIEKVLVLIIDKVSSENIVNSCLSSTMKVKGVPVIKSGTDFRVDRISVTSDYPEDKELKEKLDEYGRKLYSLRNLNFTNYNFRFDLTDMMNQKMDDVLGEFHVDLDGRFFSIRTNESNLGNF